MIVILRTLPRDDGRTSVILTRSPSDSRDPEVVKILPTSRQAVEWMLKVTCAILLGARDDGDKCRGYESRYTVQQDGPCRGYVSLDLDLRAGEEFRIEV